MTDTQSLLFPASYWMLPTQVEAHLRELGAKGLEPQHGGHMDHFRLRLAKRSAALNYYFEPAGALLERVKVVDHADKLWSTAGVAAARLGQDGVRLLASVNGVSAWAVEKADYNLQSRIDVARRYVKRMTDQIMGGAALLAATSVAIIVASQPAQGLSAEAMTGGALCLGVAVTVAVPTLLYRRNWNAYWRTISQSVSRSSFSGDSASQSV